MLVTAAGGGWNEEPAAIADCTCLNLTKPRAVRSTNVTPSVRIILLAMSFPFEFKNNRCISIYDEWTSDKSTNTPSIFMVYRIHLSGFGHQASLCKDLAGAEGDSRYGCLLERGHSHQPLASCPHNVLPGASQQSLAFLVGIPFED